MISKRMAERIPALVARGNRLLVLLAVLLLGNHAWAEPLSVRIDDHDFTFDVPLDAVYDYSGAAEDHLYVSQSGVPGHYVGQYSYTGVLPTVPGAAQGNPLGNPPAASPWPYPLYSGSPIQFAADLKLDFYFNTNDGPYTNPAGDVLDVSLVGSNTSGKSRLTITGWIATQGWPSAPLYPLPGPGPDIVLLDIEFDTVTLLARADHDVADLIEGIGTITTLLGVEVEEPDLNGGACFFKFMAPSGTLIFPSVASGDLYDPLMDYDLNPIYESRISGEVGATVPEPGTFALLCFGAIGLAAYAWRKRR